MKRLNYKIIPNLVREATACAMLGVSRITLREWRMNKNLPFVSFSGANPELVGYDKQDLKEWAKENDRRIFVVGKRR